MKNLKILFTSVILITISIVIIQSCISDNNEAAESNQINLEIEKSSQVNQESQFENLSAITKEEYLSMSSERKADFFNAYTSAFRSGGSCECDGCCSVNCPSGTKPKCQCQKPEGGCDCGCEPYSSGGIRIAYRIQQNNNDSVILIKNKNVRKSISDFSNSSLPNAKKIADLLNNETIFTKKDNGIIDLTAKEFYDLGGKFQILMENYTIEQYFEVEYGF